MRTGLAGCGHLACLLPVPEADRIRLQHSAFGNPGDERAVTLGLVSVFEASFDPAMADDGRRGLVARLRHDIGAVIGLDADRIVSAFAATMLAVVRTMCTSPTGWCRAR